MRVRQIKSAFMGSVVAHDGEAELARLIVESLHLEDLQPEDIEPEAPLFGEGLGLDSLDMLELSMAIEKKYAVKLRSDDPDNGKIFASLRSLARHIHERTAR
jgi:acyl carrier protein